MTITELYNDLIKAYSVDNLNKISLTLLTLYKNEQFSILQKISEIISDVIPVEIQDDGKGFSKLMMLYHPDRSFHHIGEINKLREMNNFNALLEYSHILKLERIEEIAASLDSFEDIDYSPVYEWDMDAEGFRVFNDFKPNAETHWGSKRCSFYDAIKIREYGCTDIEFPSYYLEDFEEFELAYSDIDDLYGIQYCVHAKSIDVSNNKIFDLTYLSDLPQLEELNLSDNKIGYIDPLSFLLKLRSLDLSNNQINDLTPLFRLKDLEYVCISGNPVKPSQIKELADLGVTVDL